MIAKARHRLRKLLRCLLVCGILAAFLVIPSVYCPQGWVTNKEAHASDQMTCRPRRSICFLKTHKCASSSVQNLLMRYGDRNNLSFVLPPKNNYLGHPKHFNRRMALDYDARRYDMLVHHSRFQEREMRAVLAPHPVFVTIVREPASLFESIFSYYALERKFGRPLNALYKSTIDSDVSSTVDLDVRFFHGKIGTNQMSFDLGFEFDQSLNASAIEGFVRYIDTTFDLVMVAERMNESLVLLRHLLCWDWDDVVMFKMNERNKKYKKRLEPEELEELRKLNTVDSELYRYFTRRLDERIAAFGRDRMAAEVEKLVNNTNKWYYRCVEDVTPVHRNQKKKFWVNPKVMRLKGREGNPEECRGLLTEELSFTDHLRRKQQRVAMTNVTTSAVNTQS